MTRCMLYVGGVGGYRRAFVSLGTGVEMACPQKPPHKWPIGFRHLIKAAVSTRPKLQRTNLPAISADCATANHPFFCPLK